MTESETFSDQALANALPCGVVDLDRWGRVREANQRALDLLRMQLTPGADFCAAISAHFELDGVTLPHELTKGLIVRVADIALLVRAGQTRGGDTGTVVTVTDVTAISRAADEHAMSLRFLLHDLRSPLNSICALAQLSADDRQSFELCGGLVRITELARYALSMGEQFIFASVTEHVRKRDFKRFDLRATVRQVVSHLEANSMFSGVALQLWMIDSAPVWVNGMRNFVARAVQNLIDNALHASRRGDAVGVSMRVGEAFVEVVVEDRAGGLPGLTKDERLTRFDQLSKNGVTGFGLGLKLAMRIVELHGGSLYAELNASGGTTFVLQLPCYRTASFKGIPVSLFEADQELHGQSR
ncbi:histidine kinase [Paraburkholderia sp. NMBU_R16]|uniref:sensor histidine kinase n=1 Tax=Paraburkholderia sp. NMBU_R16 TaxID=2698676 RepID=UPI0015677202|nr:HAMP domain-containing sensor histidine kinase [Paraburkholderia sp. NMBU_R16]NRO98860.1 histidine kinase [Paraburkholderia sp. NMBU_R16]